VAEIPTRRPIDAPGTAPFHYRFVRRLEARLDKQHMVYALDGQRFERYRELFVEPRFEVKQLPGYDPEVATNPLRAFEALPVTSRYRFLLEQAQFTLMGFIKGPVCHGQTALNVIRDRFWITFIDPDVPRGRRAGHFPGRREGQTGFARRGRQQLDDAELVSTRRAGTRVSCQEVCAPRGAACRGAAGLAAVDLGRRWPRRRCSAHCLSSFR
jgi:hypothetical protein